MTNKSDAFVDNWKSMLVGQDNAIAEIYPYVQMYEAGLSPEGRPVGVLMLLGPTGTGKTKTVETLAQMLHGNAKNILKIDCAEFQMEHEVAKLIGAPPGYLGHRETHPILTQTKLNAVTSEQSNLSIVLFDEIEKAAPSMARILLGVMDKAQLRLGDNTTVNFERSMIFMTTNLGAQEMQEYLSPGFGFEKVCVDRNYNQSKMESITDVAMKKRFSPEFINRIDSRITYAPLSTESITQILRISLEDFQNHVYNRLGTRGFGINVSQEAFDWFIEKGFSTMYGARELKRVIHKHLIQPIAAKLSNGEINSGVQLNVCMEGKGLGFKILSESTPVKLPKKKRMYA